MWVLAEAALPCCSGCRAEAVAASAAAMASLDATLGLLPGLLSGSSRSVSDRDLHMLWLISMFQGRKEGGRCCFCL